MVASKLNLGQLNDCLSYLPKGSGRDKYIINSTRGVYYLESENGNVIYDKSSDDHLEIIETSPDSNCGDCGGSGEIMLLNWPKSCNCIKPRQVSIPTKEDVCIRLFCVGCCGTSGRICDQKTIDNFLSHLEIKIFQMIIRVLQESGVKNWKSEDISILVRSIDIFDDKSRNASDGYYGWAEIGIAVLG